MICRQMPTFDPATAFARLEQLSGVIAHRGDDASMVTLERQGVRLLRRLVVRRRLRPHQVAAIAAERAAGPLLVVSEHITDEVGQRLRTSGVDYLDAAGNAHLDEPRLLVWISGRRPGRVASRVSGSLTPAVTQLAYVLLRDPAAASLSLRDLGSRAGISHGAAATALRTLEERGWLRSLGRRRRILTDPRALLDAWELAWLDRLAPRLQVTRAVGVGEGWVERVVTGGPALLGGELAAERLNLGIHGVSGVIHVRAWSTDVMRALRLLPATDGPIQILQAFGTDNEDCDHPGFADPLLVLGALDAIPDARLDGARHELRERAARRWSSG